MTPEAASFLDKARQLLADAEAMLTIALTEAAGRTAYLAGFHAAQAFIFEKRGRTFKTHSGVQAEFARLMKDDPRCDIELRRFLGRTYNLKAIADCETGPRSRITSARGKRLVKAGKKLGITVDPVARGRDGKFLPAGICWVVERSFSWIANYRRLNTIFERTREHLVAFIEIAFVSILSRRIKRLVIDEVSA